MTFYTSRKMKGEKVSAKTVRVAMSAVLVGSFILIPLEQCSRRLMKDAMSSTEKIEETTKKPTTLGSCPVDKGRGASCHTTLGTKIPTALNIEDIYWKCFGLTQVPGQL